MHISRFLFIVMVCAAAACGGPSTETGAPPPPASAPPVSAPVITVPFSSTDLAPGTGATAVDGKRVTVNYTGWLYDPNGVDQKGRQFDTSAGRKPLTFVVGKRQVIEGGDRGVEGMKVGGRRRVIIPPDMGYGEAGNRSTVPPNATLVYEVELLSVQ